MTPELMRRRSVKALEVFDEQTDADRDRELKRLHRMLEPTAKTVLHRDRLHRVRCGEDGLYCMIDFDAQVELGDKWLTAMLARPYPTLFAQYQ
jgi:hypothetical protein